MAWSAIWTDPNELGVLTVEHVEDLREALNERFDIANASQNSSNGAGAVTLTKPDFVTQTGGLELWTAKTIADQVHTAIDDLAPIFLDATADNGWTNFVDVADVVTDALGESVISKPSELDVNDWEWWSQQKRILDELRWTAQWPLTYQTTATGSATYEHRKVENSPTWASAVSAFAAASWVPSGGNRLHQVSASTGYYSIYRTRSEWLITPGTFDVPTVTNTWEGDTPSTHDPKKTWHYVGLITEESDPNPDYSTGGYGSLFIAYEQTTPNRDESYISSTGGFYVYPQRDLVTGWKLGDIDTVGWSEPLALPSSQEYDGVIGFVLHKWDVVDGLNKVL